MKKLVVGLFIVIVALFGYSTYERDIAEKNIKRLEEQLEVHRKSYQLRRRQDSIQFERTRQMLLRRRDSLNPKIEDTTR